MSTTLFIRSYPNDFHWLQYSIQSMRLFLSGVDYKLLVVPKGTNVPVAISSFFDQVIESFLYEHLDGYVGQQFDKLDAHRYVDTDHILYSDSDCIYTGPFDVSILFQDNLPILPITPYTQLADGDGYFWKGITENLLGYPVTHECMRRFPLIHRTETVAALAKDYPDLPRKVTGRNISEFNLLGAYAMHNMHPYFYTEDITPVPCRQFWSWSGMTDAERIEIGGIINPIEKDITTPVEKILETSLTQDSQ